MQSQSTTTVARVTADELGKALAFAVSKKQVKTIDMLLKQGASVTHEVEGKSLLHLAVINDDPETIVKLRKAKADETSLITVKQNEKKDGVHLDAKVTPIQNASRLGHWNCVLAFTIPVNNNEQPLSNTLFNAGNALLLAVEQKLYLETKALLMAGTFAGWRRDGAYGIHAAIQSNDLEMIRILRRSNTLHAKEIYKDTKSPIELAASLEKWDVVNLFAEELPPFTPDEIRQVAKEVRKRVFKTSLEAEIQQSNIISATTTTEQQQTALMQTAQSALNGDVHAITVLAEFYRKQKEPQNVKDIAMILTALDITFGNGLTEGLKYISSIKTTKFLFMTEPDQVSEFLLDCLTQKNHSNYFFSIRNIYKITDPIILLLAAVMLASDSEYNKDKTVLLQIQNRLKKAYLSLCELAGLNEDLAQTRLAAKTNQLTNIIHSKKLINSQPASTTQVLLAIAGTEVQGSQEEKKSTAALPIQSENKTAPEKLQVKQGGPDVQEHIINSKISHSQDEKSTSKTSELGMFEEDNEEKSEHENVDNDEQGIELSTTRKP